MIIRDKCDITGRRFDTRAGELKHFRFGYENPTFVPRIVGQCRKAQAIDWGGASVQPQDYEVLFDGPGPLHPQFKTMLAGCGLG
jgi:hypothetical protein